MAANPERIFEICQALLAAVVTHHGGTLPDRQYVSAGAPVWDCECLAVWCEGTGNYEGNPTLETPTVHSGGAGFAMRAGTFVISTARCTPAVPQGKGGSVRAPSVAQEEDAAATLYEDAQRVLNALVAAYKAGELTGCHSLAFAGWTPVGPEGGFVGGDLRVRIGMVKGL